MELQPPTQDDGESVRCGDPHICMINVSCRLSSWSQKNWNPVGVEAKIKGEAIQHEVCVLDLSMEFLTCITIRFND